MDVPSPRKVLDDRTIYLSYRMPITRDSLVISDFGAAVLGAPGEKHSGDVMPGVYRAPEIILGMEWDSKIDIWSVGVMVCSTAPSPFAPFLPYAYVYVQYGLYIWYLIC